MSDIYQSASTPNRTVRKLPFIIGGILLLTGIVGGVIGLSAYYHTERSKVVVNILETLPNIMETQTVDGNGYQQGMPANMLIDKRVTITGGGSFDGTSYCFKGVSNDDTSIVYHIDSSDKKTPKEGDCQTGNGVAAPTAPLLLRVNVITGTYIGVEWQDVANASSYTIQCATDALFTKDVSTTIAKQPTGACNDLKAQVLYYIRVRANNTSAGPWSQAVSGKTQEISVAPADLNVTAVSSTQINYSWSPVTGALNYIVERSSDLNFVNDVVSVKQTATSGVSTGLKPGTTYFYHVKAVTSDFDAMFAAFSPIAITTTKQ